MKVRIGIANTDRIIELEVGDPKAFKAEIAQTVEEGGLGWFTDAKGRSVGIPARNIAFIEVEDPEGTRTVGFAPAV